MGGWVLVGGGDGCNGAGNWVGLYICIFLHEHGRHQEIGFAARDWNIISFSLHACSIPEKPTNPLTALCSWNPRR